MDNYTPAPRSITKLGPATVPAASLEIAEISPFHISELIIIQVSTSRLQTPTARMLCFMIPATPRAEAIKDGSWCAKYECEVEANDPQTVYCVKGHLIDLSRLSDFAPMDADSSLGDPSGSEDENAGDDGDDDDDDTEGSLFPFIDDSEDTVDWKQEFTISGRRLVMEVDAVSDEAQRFKRGHDTGDAGSATTMLSGPCMMSTHLGSRMHIQSSVALEEEVGRLG